MQVRALIAQAHGATGRLGDAALVRAATLTQVARRPWLPRRHASLDRL
jgi:hypothetical protein